MSNAGATMNLAATIPVGRVAGTGTKIIRSATQRSNFLKGLAESGKAPSWMNTWLTKGRVPPGHQVHHFNPLSIGGLDIPANMRLLNTKLHRLIHKFDRRWKGMRK